MSLVLALGISALAAAPVDNYGLLQVREGKLCAADNSPANGDPIQLRGMSLFWSQYGQTWWNESAVDQSVDWLGCEIIRAPLGVGDYPTPDMPGGYMQAPELNTARVKRIVDEALYKGIYVIIDWHDTHIELPTHAEAAKGFFTQMAKEYGNVPNVLFEIVNEPVYQDWNKDIVPYAKTILDAIRGTTSDYDGNAVQNVVIVGTPNWSQLGSDVVKNPITGYDNVAYTLHFYAGSHYYSGGTKDQGKDLQDALNAGLCVVVTEWGTVESDGTGIPDKKHTQEWMDALQANKITWCNWSLNDKDEGASLFQPGTNFLGPWTTADLTASGKIVKSFLPAPNPMLSVCPSFLSFYYMGGTKTTEVLVGSYTSATSDQPDWLHVDTPSDTSLSITVDRNDGAEIRSGTINLTDGNGNTARVKVVQQVNDGNIALGKPATASSVEGNYAPENATDGDETTTRWGSAFLPADIASPDPSWITVDLGEDHPIGSVVLVWEAGYSSHYQIQVAPDGSDPSQDSSFETLYDSGTVQAGKTGSALTDTLTFLNPNDPGHTKTKSARYVRMYSFSRITDYGNSLYEFKVYEHYLTPKTYAPIYAGGGGQSVNIFGNAAWTATSDSDWLTISPDSGGQNDVDSTSTSQVSYTPNLTGQPRTGIITFTGSGVTATLKISQPDKTTSVPGYKLNATVAGMTHNSSGTDSITIDVESNLSSFSWTATSLDPDWLKFSNGGSSTTGKNNGSVKLTASANHTGSERTGIVLFTATAGLYVPVMIVQPVTNSAPLPVPAPITGGSSGLNLDLTGNWTATSSNPSWLNVYPSSGNGPSYFALVSAANYTGADRTATVTIVGSGYTQTIQVTQPTAFYSLSTTSLSVPASGGTQSFAITANTQWSAYTTAGGDWFSLGSNSYWGPGSGTISFTVARNTSGRVKVATITVQSPNLPTRYVTVTQAAR